MSIKVNYLKYNILIALLCCVISLFNLVQCIQLDTSQWQEVDITNDFKTQTFIQANWRFRSYDSLNINQMLYVNLIRDSNQNGGQILIQILNEFGDEQYNSILPVENYHKCSLTNTNVEGEFFFAYTSNLKLFFGFLDQTCSYTRGLSTPIQPSYFENNDFQNLLAKAGKDYIYVAIQQQSQQYLYLMILDVSDTSTYSIKKFMKMGTTNFRENLFSIQAFSDDFAVIFTKNDNNKLQKITIQPDGEYLYDKPQNEGIFLDLIYNSNYIQNKAIQIENTNKYCIVTGDQYYDVLNIYTFQYNGNGEIKEICLQSHKDQFENMGIYFYYGLQFGVISPDYMWIKGDNSNLGYITVIFFANPQNQNCPQYCNLCSDFENCFSCVSSIIERRVDQQCQCPDKYYQDSLSDNCLDCPLYCEKCSDLSTCQSCIISDGKRDEQNQCKCKDGYYQDTESDNCIECPYYCSTCINSSTCLSCIVTDGERDVQNLCHCKDGYQQDKKSDNCYKCNEECATCSDRETCLSCIGDTGLDLETKKCQCKQNLIQYYDKIGQCKTRGTTWL
ncbi:Insulin-like growth factor binding protein, N-terminal [Pseudocohnilembus persalinus]|uniref:Insulin-like growth factor binding protein, N-terminal n=1 Tax=Pseudocohnilembus persalinus TaxID=266149 RepID=A0A0V0R721_PSEPJ|nr:Insulin-like growth factor binding protein, N-terminal [Pseudocohnilembus persalinus]|eukprot:KRX09960.1 Insulin-like growth factor binding protein, N-terminal [Pseudocohnilembus persalinus]